MIYKFRICFVSKSWSSFLLCNYFYLLSLFDQVVWGLYELFVFCMDKLIVISGFDLFNLVLALDKSNIFGVSVLVLYQQILIVDVVIVIVIGVIFLVCYKDFN